MLKKYSFRIQQSVLFSLHIFLLYWIYFILNSSGSLTTTQISLHFTGIAIYGALLIRICAYWGQYLFRLEKK